MKTNLNSLFQNEENNEGENHGKRINGNAIEENFENNNSNKLYEAFPKSGRDISKEIEYEIEAKLAKLKLSKFNK